MLTQNHWINSLKSDCNFCHQLGNQLTRSVDQCSRRSRSSRRTPKPGSGGSARASAATSMYGVLDHAGQGAIAEGVRRLDRAHRQGRSAAGAAAAKGIERNIVVDAVGRGRRPLVHARRDLDRQEPSDRERATGRSMRCPPATASWSCWTRTRTAPSRWTSRRASRRKKSRRASRRRTARRCTGATSICGRNPPYNPADPHNPMLDSKGRVWMTSKIRGNNDPSWCSDRDQQVRRMVPAAQQRPAGVVLRSEDEASSR